MGDWAEGGWDETMQTIDNEDYTNMGDWDWHPDSIEMKLIEHFSDGSQSIRFTHTARVSRD